MGFDSACECDQDGWCERYGRRMVGRLRDLCRTDASYRIQLGQKAGDSAGTPDPGGCAGCGSGPIMDRSACVHLGERIGEQSASGSPYPDTMYECRHPRHSETTARQCRDCPDRSTEVGAPVPTLASLYPTPAPTGPSVSRWQVGVTTAPRRGGTVYVDHCLDSMRREWGEDVVVFAEPNSPLADRHRQALTVVKRPWRYHCWGNWLCGMMELYHRDPHADAYMVCQDDVVFATGTRAYCEQALFPTPDCLIVSLYTSRAYAQSAPGWYRLAHSWVWGACAFVLSNAGVRAMLTSETIMGHRWRGKDGQGIASADHGERNTDVIVGRWAREQGCDVWYPAPSLVQHVGDVSSMFRNSRAIGKRRASSFAGDVIRGAS